MEDRIFELLLDEETPTWQSLMMQIVKEEGMDPWNIDVSKITKGYISSVKKLKEANLSISGKVVLASALLLKVKSKHLLEHDLQDLDDIFDQAQELPVAGQGFDEDFGDIDLLMDAGQVVNKGKEVQQVLVPRTPRPRERKVSVYDLIDALDKAMKVRTRRVNKKMPAAKQKIELPENVDVTKLIVNTYKKVHDFARLQEELTFHHLCSKDEHKKAKVQTFIPLLHLFNERRIDLKQDEHFGDIHIKVRPKNVNEASQ